MNNGKINVDIDLLKKYDRAGPRYTSYPTAPYFHDGIRATDFISTLDKDSISKKGEDLSLYFHLPFCDTLCYFCGCTMLITHNPKRIDEYIDYLEKEMALLAPHIGQDRHVIQLHWGGGTPTYLSPDQIRRLGQSIHQHFSFRENAEISVEIDPRELTRDHMVALKESGFNRCSMGVQDFDPKVQKAVNRVQPESITRAGVDWARELGFTSINLDLMYGLPYQKIETFADTLKRIINISPDRLAVFNYAHLPGLIKHQQVIKGEMMPKPEEKLQLLKLAIETLADAGYVYIGMDHFAKPDDELSIALENGTLYRNFQGYSTHTGLNMLSLGMSSISMLSDLYVQNEKNLPEYYKRLDDGELPILRGVQLNEDDILRRDVIVEIMCQFKIIKSEIEERYSIDFDEYFGDALEALVEFEKDGLIKLDPEKILVTPDGRMLIRNIAMNFDAYLMKKEGYKPQYSRTV